MLLRKPSLRSGLRSNGRVSARYARAVFETAPCFGLRSL